MVNKPKSDSKVTRQSLIDAFCLLHANEPVSKITVSKLTKKAGVDRTTFYQYFLDMPDLNRAIEKEFVDYLVILQSKTDVVDDSIVATLIQAYGERQLEFNALLGEYGSLHFVQLLSTAFYKKLPELNSASDSAEQPYLIEFHLMTTVVLFRLWLRRHQDLPVEQFMKLTNQLYLTGVQGLSNRRL